MPAEAPRQRRQPKAGLHHARVEHQEKHVLPVFMDKAGERFAPWVCPVGRPLLRTKPMNPGVGVELLLA